MVQKHHTFFRLLFFLVLFIKFSICFATPPNNGLQGRLIFLGVNHNSTTSIWLSLTSAAGSFKLEGPGNQLIDEWSKTRRGLRLSLSPIVSNGNGGTHHLINAANNKKLDSQNQQGGMVFPPFPPWQPGFPSHPIIIPGPGPSHPIVIPGPGPSHPIVIPGPGPSHPIVIPGPGPSHPIVIPGSAVSQGGASTAKSTATKTQVVKQNNFTQSAPITKGRQLEEQEDWNIWSDNYYFGIRDGRNIVNTQGEAANFTLGADRRISKNLVGGLTVAAVQLTTKAFGDGLENNIKGFKFGPYFGYQLSKQWAIDALFNYGQYSNNNKILTLNSSYITRLLNATLHAIGLYQFGHFQLRPQPLLSYTSFRNPTYNLSGTIANTPVQVTRGSESFALGFAEFKIEGNYTKEIKNDIYQPYIEIGVDYAFTRPANDQVYSGNLALGSVPELTGLATVGLRAILGKNFTIEASTSYLSIGESSYDVWDAKLLIAYSFS